MIVRRQEGNRVNIFHVGSVIGRRFKSAERTIPTNLTLFLQFDGFIDLDGYDAIAVRLRGDGRCYISTVSFMLILTFPLLQMKQHTLQEQKGC